MATIESDFVPPSADNFGFWNHKNNIMITNFFDADLLRAVGATNLVFVSTLKIRFVGT